MGSYMEYVTQADPAKLDRLMKELDGFLERDRDRELFDLALKPRKAMMYLLSDVINSVGLALDIGGVILLFLFALPSRVSEEPTIRAHLVWLRSRQYESSGRSSGNGISSGRGSPWAF